MWCGIVLFLFLCPVESIFHEHKYTRIFELLPCTKEEVIKINELLGSRSEFDFLTQPGVPNEWVRVIVARKDKCKFLQLIGSFGIKYRIVNRDLSETIKEQISPETRGLFPLGKIKFNKYYRYSEINEYLKKLVAKYPDRVRVEEIGKSYEGRAINAITITDGIERSDKRVVLMDAGIHAREWLAPMTALYAIKELVENFENNRDVLRNTKWVIVPLLNPDGYEYSHTKKRLWRKTRKPNTNQECPGTDANRNFDYAWELYSERDECEDNYSGPHALSEPETIAMKDLMIRFQQNCKLYLTLHSYGPYIFLPLCSNWTGPANVGMIRKVAIAGYEAILLEKGVMYRVKRPMEVLYLLGGCSMDSASQVVEIPVAISMELAPGGGGFDPTKKELAGLAEEGWIGIRAMGKKIQDLYPLEE